MRKSYLYFCRKHGNSSIKTIRNEKAEVFQQKRLIEYSLTSLLSFYNVRPPNFTEIIAHNLNVTLQSFQWIFF